MNKKIAIGLATIGLLAFALSVSAAQYTSSEVSAHNTATDCWGLVGDKVYDLTNFIPLHPGGTSTIISLCGADMTTTFNSKHGTSSLVTLATYLKGDLTVATPTPAVVATPTPVTVATPTPPTIPVIASGTTEMKIDVKVGDSNNILNLGSNAIINVAIFANDTVKAKDMKPRSFKLGEAKIVSWNFRDVNKDGKLDLVGKFRVRSMKLASTTAYAVFTGETKGGQKLMGYDAVKVVKNSLEEARLVKKLEAMKKELERKKKELEKKIKELKKEIKEVRKDAKLELKELKKK